MMRTAERRALVDEYYGRRAHDRRGNPRRACRVGSGSRRRWTRSVEAIAGRCRRRRFRHLRGACAPFEGGLAAGRVPPEPTEAGGEAGPRTPCRSGARRWRPWLCGGARGGRRLGPDLCRRSQLQLPCRHRSSGSCWRAASGCWSGPTRSLRGTGARSGRTTTRADGRLLACGPHLGGKYAGAEARWRVVPSRAFRALYNYLEPGAEPDPGRRHGHTPVFHDPETGTLHNEATGPDGRWAIASRGWGAGELARGDEGGLPGPLPARLPSGQPAPDRQPASTR